MLLVTYFGLARRYISFNENLNKVYNLINFNPDDVENDEPPITTKIKNKNVKLEVWDSIPRPMFDKLLITAKKIYKITGKAAEI